MKGVTGKVVIDDNGDRIPNYYVSKIDSTGAFLPFLLLGANDTSINKAQIGVKHDICITILILHTPVYDINITGNGNFVVSCVEHLK